MPVPANIAAFSGTDKANMARYTNAMATEEFSTDLIKNKEQMQANPLGTLRNRVATWDHMHLDVTFVLALAALQKVASGDGAAEEVNVALRILNEFEAGLDTDEVLLKYGARPHASPPPLAIDDNLYAELHAASANLFYKDTQVPPEGTEEFLNSFRDDELILQTLGWIQKSRRVYEISPENARLYGELDFKQWTWKQLLLPFDYFVIQFPSILRLSSGKNVQLHGVMVSRMHSSDPSFPEDQIEIQPILSPFDTHSNKKLIRIPSRDRGIVLQAIRRGKKALEDTRNGKKLSPNYLQSINAAFREGSKILQEVRHGNAHSPEINGKVFRIPMDENIVASDVSESMNMMRKIVAAVCLEKMYVKNETERHTTDSSAPAVTPLTPLVIPPGKRNQTVDSIFAEVNVIRETVGDPNSGMRLARAINEHDREGHRRRLPGWGHVTWEEAERAGKVLNIKPTRVRGRLLPRDVGVPPTTLKKVNP